MPDLAHPGIRRLQRTWVLFALPVLVVTAVVAIASPQSDSSNGELFAIIAAVIAVIDFGSLFWIRRIGADAILSAESNAEIRDAYTRRMLLACAFAAIPPLLAFAFVLVAGITTAFLLIAAASLLLLGLAGPRRRDIDVLDVRMVEAGRPFRVSAALDS